MELTHIGLAIFIAGFLAIFLGVVLIMLWGFRAKSRVKAGGAVLIGPFPILFGDKDLIRYSLALLLIMVFLLVFMMLIPFLFKG